MASSMTSQTRNALAERRRHARYTPSAIMYITLGSGNGGLLLNLGIGGLAIQAAGKFTPNQDLVLQFKLAGRRDTIKAVGHVAWLGPTQKEAGVCFADLPDGVEQRIAEWIANQESATIEARPSPKQVAAPTGNSVIPGPPVSNQPITPPIIFSPRPPETILNPRGRDGFSANPASSPSRTPANYAPVGSEDRGSEDRQQRTNGKLPNKSAGFSMLYGAPKDTSALPAEIPAWLVNQGAGTSLPAVESVKLPPLAATKGARSLAGVEPAAAGLSPVAAAPAGLSFTPAVAAGMPAESSVPPSSEVLASSDVRDLSDSHSGILPASSVPSAVSKEKQPRRKLILAGLAAGLVLLAGIAISVRTTKLPKHSVPAREAVTAVAPPANQPVIENRKMQQRSIPVDTDTGWSALVKKLFRHDDTAKMDPGLLNVPVWTHQRNGYYYCAGSPEIEKLKIGSFMTQAEALQSGYQPNLGSYCY
jgi:hypothetical protein